MKLRKIMSTFMFAVLMIISMATMVFAANTITYTCDPVSGSTVVPGQKIKVTAAMSDQTKGFKSFTAKLYDKDTNELINKNDALITETKNGNNDVICTLLIPSTCKAKELKVEATGEDSKGNKTSETFTFRGPVTDDKPTTNDKEGIATGNGNTLKITADKPSGSIINPGQIIQFVTTSSNKSVGTKVCQITISNNKTGKVIETKQETSKQEIGANPFKWNKSMPQEPGEYKVVVKSKDINGLIATRTFIYIVKGDASEKDDEPEDDENSDSEGIINPDLDGVVIDLWLREKNRFYELDEEDIPFIAYYYNAEKKTAKNVTIEVEIPDGFKVVSKSTPVGTVTFKNDTIKYKIGDVESKKLGKVYFTLRAIDDEVCEQVTNITAVILKDDDEEDQSTQRIWIYEQGGKGSFTSYVTGYTDGTFRQDNDITREEVAAIMARAFGHKVINTTRVFSDIKKTGWAYNYIMACATKGIITGYTDGTFRPYKNITRAELYAMTYRAMDIPTDEQALFVPKRYKKDDSWEKNYVAGLTRLRMLTDMNDTDPDENASRADVVYLVNGVQFRNPSKMMDVQYSDLTSSHWCAKHIAAASVNYSFKRGANGKEIVTNK